MEESCARKGKNVEGKEKENEEEKEKKVEEL